MAKKEGDWKSILFDVFSGQVLSGIKEKAQNAVVVTQKKILRRAMALILLLLGVIFVILGSIFYLVDIIGINRSTVYLIVGVILLLISVILAQSSKLLKY